MRGTIHPSLIAHIFLACTLYTIYIIFRFQPITLWQADLCLWPTCRGHSNTNISCKWFFWVFNSKHTSHLQMSFVLKSSSLGLGWCHIINFKNITSSSSDKIIKLLLEVNTYKAHNNQIFIVVIKFLEVLYIYKATHQYIYIYHSFSQQSLLEENLVLRDHPLRLVHCNPWYVLSFGYIDEWIWISNNFLYYHGSWTVGNQNTLLDNQNDLSMHLLAMSCNEQVATDICNGQVFFQWLNLCM